MRELAALTALVVLAGCGGEKREAAVRTATAPPRGPAAGNPFPQDTQILARQTTSGQRRSLRLLAADIVRMRAAARAAPASASPRFGTPRVQAATDRFLRNLDASTVDDLSKNRIIDHGAAAVIPVCEQCFQMLEAVRPIPAIAH